MKKIPTMFERDWAGDKSRVLDKVTPGCEWVFNGEGVATRKIDGTSCMVRDKRLYKRREIKQHDPEPAGFELVNYDEETGKRIGWVPVGDGLEDRWHREAFEREGNYLPDGTYELIGPKVQGNPEDQEFNLLIPHYATGTFVNAPRTYNELREWLSGMDVEGLVFHHPDGRMAKIKKRDFGLKRR